MSRERSAETQRTVVQPPTFQVCRFQASPIDKRAHSPRSLSSVIVTLSHHAFMNCDSDELFSTPLSISRKCDYVSSNGGQDSRLARVTCALRPDTRMVNTGALNARFTMQRNFGQECHVKGQKRFHKSI